MPRNYPPAPDYSDPRFAAERKVWNALQGLPDNCVIISQYRMKDRLVTREADLIVIVPDVGLGVLEVKGGRVFSQDFEWHSIDRFGRDHQIHSPIQQADRFAYLMKNFVEHQGGFWPGHVPVAVLPNTQLPVGFSQADSRPEQWIDGMADLPQRVLKAIAIPGAPDQQWVDELVEILEQRLPKPVAWQKAEVGLDRADMITRDQYAILRALRTNDRILVTGGPGTGKTWLALEHAHQEATLGARVAVLCYNRALGLAIQSRAKAWPESQRPVFVGTLHQLAIEWTGIPVPDDADDSFWFSLPAAAAAVADQRDRFDLLIIDEAQDFAAEWWPHVRSLLVEPESGPMVVFADEDQSLYGRGALGDLPTVEVTLSENVRNTEQISAVLQALSDDPIRARGASGPAVMFLPVAQDAVIDAANDAVAALRDNGEYRAGDIALLTTHRRHPEQIRRQDTLGPVAFAETLLSPDEVAVSTVKGFKGLERPAVVLAVNGFHSKDQARSLLLVGASRATHQLVVIGDQEILLGAVGQRFLAALGS